MSATAIQFIERPEYLLAVGEDGSVFIALETPLRCGGCGEMHCFFVNRYGSTLCAACHEQFTRPLAGNIEVRR